MIGVGFCGNIGKRWCVSGGDNDVFELLEMSYIGTGDGQALERLGFGASPLDLPVPTAL